MILRRAIASALILLALVSVRPYLAVLHAAVTLGNTASADSAGSASTLSTSAFTVTGGAGTLLVCGVGYTDGGQQPSGLAWDAAGVNQALTQIKREREAVNTGLAIDIWVKYAPTGGASKTVTATLTGALTGWGIGCVEFGGTDTSTPYGTPASADTEGGPSDPVTCTSGDYSAGDYMVNFMVAATASTVGTGTSFYDSTTSGIQIGGATHNGGATITWTKDGGGNQHWSSACVGVNQSGGGGGGTAKSGLLLRVGDER